MDTGLDNGFLFVRETGNVTILSTGLSQGCWPHEFIAVTSGSGVIVRTNIFKTVFQL